MPADATAASDRVAGPAGRLRRRARGLLAAIARAYYVFALAPNESGYTVCWGVYADRVSWVIPYYMSLIDPYDDSSSAQVIGGWP